MRDAHSSNDTGRDPAPLMATFIFGKIGSRFGPWVVLLFLFDGCFTVVFLVIEAHEGTWFGEDTVFIPTAG